MSTEIMRQESAQLDPMQMIQIAFQEAIKQGGALEVVDRILEQQKWMIRHNEEEAFNSAMQRIKSQLRVIVKDKDLPGKGKYASSEAIDKAIVTLCNAERIELAFDTEDSGTASLLRFVCDASLGAYTKRFTLPLPVDGSGPKGGSVMNMTDATCAAVTKGKRYLKNMIFNLRIEEKDYEAGAEETPQMDVGAVADWIAGIEAATTLEERGKALASANDAILAFGDRGALIEVFCAALGFAPTKEELVMAWRWMCAQIDTHAPKSLLEAEKTAVTNARDKRRAQVK